MGALRSAAVSRRARPCLVVTGFTFVALLSMGNFSWRLSSGVARDRGLGIMDKLRPMGGRRVIRGCKTMPRFRRQEHSRRYQPWVGRAGKAKRVSDEDLKGLIANMSKEEEEPMDMVTTMMDPMETIWPHMTPEEKGYVKRPEDMWDPGIYKLPKDINEPYYEYSAKAECDNFDLEYVRGRVRGNETHPYLWWERTGCICVINTLADTEDYRPWEYNVNPETGWEKRRGWLCVPDVGHPDYNSTVAAMGAGTVDNPNPQPVRLVGFESPRDAKRVREIMSRDLINRLREPFIEYVTPEEFKAASIEMGQVNGSVTVVQAPLFYVYGTVDLPEVVEQITKHPRDKVVPTLVTPDMDPDKIDPWKTYTPDWDKEIQEAKEYIEAQKRVADGKVKSIQDILDDSREVGGL